MVSVCCVFTHARDVPPRPVTYGCQEPGGVVSTCCVFTHTHTPWTFSQPPDARLFSLPAKVLGIL